MAYFLDETDQPQFAYPCAWGYRVLGTDCERLRAAVASAVGNVDYVLNFSRESHGGRYVAMNLELVVTDEEHRTSIYRALKQSEDVILVL